MSQQRAPSGCRSGIASRCALAAIMLVGIIPLAVARNQKDANKDKEFSVTVQGPDTGAGLLSAHGRRQKK
jgi:hypothetical protein